MRVLIDAGHGIDTPGKRSPDGSFLEYLWNRQVADLVIELTGGKLDFIAGKCEVPAEVTSRADALAERLYEAFARAFPEKRMRRDLADGDSDKESNFYILTKTRCPAVLTENFFYDNREECAWLLRRTTQERVADATVAGIKAYLGI